MNLMIDRFGDRDPVSRNGAHNKSCYSGRDENQG